jgi:hypothetical protein
MHRALALSRRRRRWLLCAGAAAGAYLTYHHPAVAARRRRLARLAAALASLADAAAAAASDLAAFLRSDADEVPHTIRQVSKLAASPEAAASVTSLTQALACGALRGHAAATGSGAAAAGGGGVALSDRLLERLLSPRAERVVSAAAAGFARGLVLAFYSAPARSQPSASAAWVDVLTARRCQRAIRSWVEVFTATAVAVFIDKTIHINTYDQLFAAATNPAHDARLQNLLVALCNASVATLVKTSHGVLSSVTSTGGDAVASGSGTSGGNGVGGERWVEAASSALAVPSNRRLVLDLTGRASFEAVRSFLDFVLWKLHAGGDATVHAGVRALRYTSERSVVIATICIALCLHVLNGTWLAAPACA